MSHVSQKNLDMIGTLAEELEAIADLAALRKALVRKAGAGYETYSNEALIEELDRRAKDSAAEARKERESAKRAREDRAVEHEEVVRLTKVATDRFEEIRRLERQVKAAGYWIDDSVIAKVDAGQPFYLRGKRWVTEEAAAARWPADETVEAIDRGYDLVLRGRRYIWQDKGIYSIEGIPDHVVRVRAVEDHAEVFERVASGIYKGLWKNTRSGGYYDTVELLTLTDVEAF